MQIGLSTDASPNAWVSLPHYVAITAQVEQKTIKKAKGPKTFDTAAPLIPVFGGLHVGGLDDKFFGLP